MYSLLRSGVELHIYGEALYDYAQLPNSLSRRMVEQDFVDILAEAEVHLASIPGQSELARAQAMRIHTIRNGLTHIRFVEALKKGRWWSAFGTLCQRPRALGYVWRYLGESVHKRLPVIWPGRGYAANPAPVAFFAQDRTDSAVIRRIAAFQASGAEVLAFSFHRRKFNRQHQPAWRNIDLGETVDRHYLRRLWKLGKAVVTIVRHRRLFADTQMFYARNLDMAGLACFARLVSRSKAPFAYEVLDIQRAFLGSGPAARFFRWAEQQILAVTRTLVVSSPAYLSEYFIPQQKFSGQWFILENKIVPAQLRSMPPPACDASARLAAIRRGRLVIGWFGTLRCVESLNLLAAIAAALPERILVYLRGLPTETGLAPFLEVVSRFPNMIYDGEFFSPRDLASLYGATDLAWCFDFLDSGGNSDWLLPNRLYDAGYFNVPPLADADTETGRRIAELGLGWTFRAPFRQSLIAFLGSISESDLSARRSLVATLPRHLFVETDETARMIMSTMAARSGRRCRPDANPLFRPGPPVQAA